jgi:PAS domain S-box-containing protein
MKSLDNYVKKGLFYESVVEDGSDLIFVLDYDASFLYHNTSVKETLGYANKALVGKNFFEFIHAAEVPVIRKKFNACKRRPYCQGVEFRFLCKDGTYRFLEFNSINLKQKEGLHGLIMDCRDITQRKKDAEELLMAQKARELFMANISHEIRTPINGISGMATLLSNNPSAEDSITYLNAIKSASENLKVIINDILDLASIESGKLKFERIGFNMMDLIASLIDIFKAQALAKNLQLNYQVSPNAKGIFMGDPVRLNQILVNLIGNAIKFTHHGSITLNVSVLKSVRNKKLLQFDVTDTGIGVPAEKLHTIFESFSQADASVTRKYGGTGLGLTIVKQLVEMQKGWIKVESKEGLGSTFTVAIPYVPVEAERDVRTALRTEKKEEGPTDLSGFTILLVEDNDINRIYAGSLLKMSGCKIEMAENGMVALEKIKNNHVDLILMDLQMPVMDGYEATKAIRLLNDKKSKEVPIIALTANATPRVIEKCMSLGMNEHLAKPFTPDELFRTLGKFLNYAKQVKPTGRQDLILPRNFATVDLSFLAKVSGNDKQFIVDVVRSFLQATPLLLDGIREALRESDPQKLGQRIHRIKPSLTMLGLSTAKSLAESLEDELGRHELSGMAKKIVNELCDEVARALEELSGF